MHGNDDDNDNDIDDDVNYTQEMDIHFSHFYLFSDEDECQDQKHNCDVNALCNNTFGSYNCTCVNGYSGDGVSCLGTYYSLKCILSREYKTTRP